MDFQQSNFKHNNHHLPSFSLYQLETCTWFVRRVLSSLFGSLWIELILEKRIFEYDDVASESGADNGPAQPVCLEPHR